MLKNPKHFAHCHFGLCNPHSESACLVSKAPGRFHIGNLDWTTLTHLVRVDFRHSRTIRSSSSLEILRASQSFPELSQSSPELFRASPELSRAFPELLGAPSSPQSFPELPRALGSSPDLPRVLPELSRAPQRSPEFPRVPQSSPELSRAPQSFPELSRASQSSSIFFPSLYGSAVCGLVFSVVLALPYIALFDFVAIYPRAISIQVMACIQQ